MSEAVSKPAPGSDPAAAPSPDDRSPAAPLFVWLVLQLLALSLAALRVPLSARFPLPGEQFAIHVMLITQVVASAMLFPFLMPDVKSTAMVILTIAPFVQLSGYLSAVPMGIAALAGLYVATWLLTLATWGTILRSQRSEMFGVACALALSLGGVVIWYLRAESRESAPTDWSHDGMFGPILGALAQLHAASVSSWGVAIILLIAGAIVFVSGRKQKVGRSGNRPADS